MTIPTDSHFPYSALEQNFEISAPAFVMPNFHPVISAPAAIIVDVASGTPIWGKNVEEERAIASLTKLMTALIIVESHDMSEVVTVSSSFQNILGAKMKVVPGEKITIENLLNGLLIPSGNDAAHVLAEYHSGSEEAFVKEMNMRAYYLGMQHTHFQNPHGLDADQHYSSPADLAILTRKILEYPKIREIIRMKKKTVFSVDGGTQHALTSTNELLFSPFPVYGVKTGTTDKAGQCLIALIKNDRQEVLVIVLGSTDRFHDVKTMLRPFLPVKPPETAIQ
ncbi:D-alanyl-D-alanine carboxypeptidase [Candidatus Peregrinibacteria bacterium]|nr:D-alanyl-D-alanine carboxypeptidase [Candidatus Peregrinibacteria bacterium]